jgi:DNA-binding NarL/FixJ family response regulator
VVKRRRSSEEEEILKLVRTGVERFILKKATVAEFLETIQMLTNEGTFAHQLTRSAFAKIVKEAIRKRNLSRPIKP